MRPVSSPPVREEIAGDHKRASPERKPLRAILRDGTQYQELTGETPDMSDTKTVRIRDSYRWVGLRVDFPMPKDDEKSFLDIPKGVHMSTDGYNCSISDNAFVGGFLRMGLKLGKNKGWAKKAA